jgi:hypothetical protein
VVTNGVLAWTPTEEQGPSTNEITVTVTDGVGTETNSFVITVLEVNALPTLAGATNATISELVGYTQNLTPGDVDIPAQSLTVTLLSGPTGLMVTNGVLAWTPTEEQGPSTNEITVTVTDGVGTVTNSFLIAVLEVNALPTLAGATNATISELVGYTQNLVPGDVDIPAQSLTVTLVSGPAGLVVTNGVLAWTPTEEQGPSTNEITVTVTDGLGTATRTLVLTVTELNDVPTISGISDQTTLEDTATSVIAFTVGDVETAAGSLTVTATSSNLGVVATNGIALGGSGANRTITLTPVANASGTNTITVTVTDGSGGSATRSFALTVSAVNDVPTISTISDQTTLEDTATSAIAFTVGDVETAAGSLTVTATSSNLGVVATNGIALSGSGTNRTITLSPVANASGTNTITVTVTDGSGGSATRTFALTVTDLNDTPTITAISDQSTAEDTATSAIAFTVGDVETAAGSLTVTATSSNLSVVSTNGIALGGSGANRTITLTPVANASGTNTITVTVTDGSGGSATRSFALTVSAVNDVPTISGISDQTTLEDTATSAIAFTVGDVETAAGSLTVTATSSNLGVVDTNGIALGGSGTNRTITLTPVANASGTNTITVTVTDGSGGTATRSFVLIVTPVPDVQTLEGFLLGAGLMPVVGGDGRYRLEASLGQAIAGSLPKVGSLDLASGFWFLDRLADALPGQLGDIPTPAQAAKGLVLQRATVAASRTDRLSSGTAPQMASGVRLPEARIRVAAVGDTAKVRILVSGLPKARWRVHSREGFGAGSWRDDGILQLDGEGEGFLETSGGDASAMRFYRLVQP